MSTTSNSSPESIAALRTAAAVVVCLVCAERLHLAQPGLAVWSAYLVLVQVTFTSFQKGVERVLGRSLGIVAALVLATLTRNAPLLGFILELFLIVPLFYVYFCGRLAYTFLNAGLYLASVMAIARTSPSTVFEMSWDLFVAILLGVSVAVLVNWLAGGEQELVIHTEGAPLWSVNRDRLIHSIMLMITVALVQCVSEWLRLSTSTAIVSVLLLTITPDYQSLLHKGELRVAGAVLAIVFASPTLVLLIRRPSFPLLVVALFLGTFLAATLATRSERWSYAGIQMGLVLPMILVAPHQEFDSLHAAFARVGGAILAIAGSIFVGIVWGAFGRTPPLPLTAGDRASGQ